MYKLILLCVIGTGLVNAAKLPSPIEICKYDNDKCLLAAANGALPVLVPGIPKLNLAALDPLSVSIIDIDQGDSKGPVAIKLKFTDSKLLGLKDAVFTSIKGASKTPKGFNLEIAGTIKNIKLVGEYEVSGKVLILPLTGKGPSLLSLDDVKFTAVLVGADEPKIIKGKEHVQLKKFDFKFVTSKLTINLEGLHGGDKVLGDSTNLFLNENWKDILVELQPSVEAAFSEIFLELSNRFFAKAEYSELFKPE